MAISISSIVFESAVFTFWVTKDALNFVDPAVKFTVAFIFERGTRYILIKKNSFFVAAKYEFPEGPVSYETAEKELRDYLALNPVK